MNPDSFFNQIDKDIIVQAIKEAELNTSGELRVHIDATCNGEILDCAAAIFAKLDMHKTELRNGVLFYLAIKSKKFAVIGDVGINKVVPEGFWDTISAKIIEEFKQGKFAEGLRQGILTAGEQLKLHFPYQDGDVNELSDEISFGA